MRSFFDAAYVLEGEERAVMLTLRLVAGDVTYQPQPWLRELLAFHREALSETFAIETQDTDYLCSDDP